MGIDYPASARTAQMNFMTVPSNGFPNRRKPHCCGEHLKRGDSVLIIDGHNSSGRLESPVILHRRCLVGIIEKMPYDTDDYVVEFERIRNELMSKEQIL